MNESIVSILKQQHAELFSNLNNISSALGVSSNVDMDKIFKILDMFKTNLIEHLKLENEVFYVQLLEKMRQKELDTRKTEEFIAEMKNIEREVLVFFEEYKDIDSARNDLGAFKNKFEELKEALRLRIESEEMGVFSYWELF